MSRQYLILCIYLSVLVLGSTVSSAIENVDCRVATGDIDVCNPYGSKLLIAKEINYRKDRKKLIVVKSLPVPEKSSVKVISVVDMIEKYVQIEKPIRYEGSAERELEVLKIESPKDSNRYSLSRELDLRRETLLKKLQQMEEESYSKMLKHDQEVQRAQFENAEVEVSQIAYEMEEEKLEGFYTIEKGDSLSTIARKFCIKTAELKEMNEMQKGTALKVGKKLTLPLAQEMVDIIAKAEYTIQSGDNIGTIARDFNLSSSDIIKYNDLNKKATICIGKKLVLPFPYKIKQLEKARSSRVVRGLGKRKLRVTATAYSSHYGQTDKTPFLAAWNNRIRPGMKIIAVSRDMLTRYGLRNGSKVRIGGLPGYYTVRDKMNKRYRKRIDIYMGTNRRRALRWGRRSVMLYY
jgi:LysM repeat protein